MQTHVMRIASFILLMVISCFLFASVSFSQVPLHWFEEDFSREYFIEKEMLNGLVPEENRPVNYLEFYRPSYKKNEIECVTLAYPMFYKKRVFKKKILPRYTLIYKDGYIDSIYKYEVKQSGIKPAEQYTSCTYSKCYYSKDRLTIQVVGHRLDMVKSIRHDVTYFFGEDKILDSIKSKAFYNRNQITDTRFCRDNKGRLTRIEVSGNYQGRSIDTTLIIYITHIDTTATAGLFNDVIDKSYVNGARMIVYPATITKTSNERQLSKTVIANDSIIYFHWHKLESYFSGHNCSLYQWVPQSTQLKFIGRKYGHWNLPTSSHGNIPTGGFISYESIITENSRIIFKTQFLDEKESWTIKKNKYPELFPFISPQGDWGLIQYRYYHSIKELQADND